MTLLNRESIRNADDIKFEDVTVPEWGGAVRVRALSGTERDKFEAAIVGDRKSRSLKLDNLRARLVAMSIVDENNQRIFSDADIPWLGKKSAAALQRVYAVCQRLSGLSDAEAEELAGNSDAAPSGDFTSD